MRNILTFLTFLFYSFPVCAQVDTTISLKETIVKGFETKQTIQKTAAALSYIKLPLIQRFANTDLAEVFNSQAGVRLEERSPGSYRIAIRGSSLRSPFGVRNVKVYWNGIPISDGNGISYFNQLDINSVGSIEILKGPSGSIFGAGIGGVINMNSKTAAAGNVVEGGLLLGSYGTLNSFLSYQKGSSKQNTFINFSTTNSDGYRVNSASDKKTLNFSTSLFLSPKHTINVVSFLSDLGYQTPGGLTLAQKLKDPKSARPKTAVAPGAVEQKAAIYQKIGFFGLSDQYELKQNWLLNTSIFINANELQNPFITNYEKRKEHSLGYRILLSKTLKNFPISFWFGSEGQQTISTFDVFDNNSGKTGNHRYLDEANSKQNSAFSQVQLVIPGGLIINTGFSLNYQSYEFKRNSDIASVKNFDITDKPVVPFTPRISILKNIKDKTSIYASFSNGFSAPTAAEFVSSIQYDPNFVLLKAEKAFSEEFGIKHYSNRWTSELALFRQKIKNGLVRKLDAAGNEFFNNSGLINQIGMEFSNGFVLVKNNSKQFFRSMDIQINYVFNDFEYENYTSGTVNLSGKYLPGVAKNNVLLKYDFVQKKGFFLNFDVNYLSKIPLLDDNSVYAEKAIIGLLRVGYGKELKKVKFKMYGGINNLFNADYSAGYDFNAFGNRFYNPTAPRNFNGGFSMAYKF